MILKKKNGNKLKDTIDLIVDILFPIVTFILKVSFMAMIAFMLLAVVQEALVLVILENINQLISIATYLFLGCIIVEIPMVAYKIFLR